MKKTLLLLLLLFNFISVKPANAATDDIINFTDVNLKREVNRALNVTDVDADITQGQIANLYSLRISGQYTDSITSFEGLQFAVNLNTIRLGSYYPSRQATVPPKLLTKDLTPLYNLPKFVDFALFSNTNSITTFDEIKNLTNLATLHINHEQFTDFSGLKNLTKLTTIDMRSDDGVSKPRSSFDFSIIGDNLPNLTTLNLENFDFSNQTDFSKLLKLKTISIYDTNISDISTLNPTTPLTNIIFSHNSNLVDVSQLGNIPTITAYNLSYNSIADISFIANTQATNLTGIYLYGNKITSLDGLANANLPKLETLSLSENQITSLDGLATAMFPLLDDLDLKNNNITDINGLKNFSAPLTFLDLRNNHISKFDSLAKYDNGVTKVYAIQQTITLASTFIDSPTKLSLFDHKGNELQYVDLNSLQNTTKYSTFKIINGDLFWDEITPSSQDDYDSLLATNYDNKAPASQSIYIGVKVTQNVMPVNIVKFTVTFNLNGISGKAPATQNLEAGQLVAKVINPSYSGYEFVSWNTKADGSGTTWNFEKDVMPANNLVLYAQWEKIKPNPKPIPNTGNNNLVVILTIFTFGVISLSVYRKRMV